MWSESEKETEKRDSSPVYRESESSERNRKEREGTRLQASDERAHTARARCKWAEPRRFGSRENIIELIEMEYDYDDTEEMGPDQKRPMPPGNFRRPPRTMSQNTMSVYAMVISVAIFAAVCLGICLTLILIVLLT